GGRSAAAVRSGPIARAPSSRSDRPSGPWGPTAGRGERGSGAAGSGVASTHLIVPAGAPVAGAERVASGSGLATHDDAAAVRVGLEPGVERLGIERVDEPRHEAVVESADELRLELGERVERAVHELDAVLLDRGLVAERCEPRAHGLERVGRPRARAARTSGGTLAVGP